MSSRLIVKNLPKDITKQQLKEHFSKFGQVTDVRMVHTRSGKFRRFCFIGFPNESLADETFRYFNQTYIGSSKIEMGVAHMYGDSEIPRPWSKYSKGSSAYTKLNPNIKSTSDKKEDKKKDKKDINYAHHKSELSSLLGEYYELEKDPKFVEFLEANKKRGSGQGAWSNDEKTSVVEEKQESDKDLKQENESLSDLDYLKSKVVNKLSNETSSLLYTIRMRGLPFKCTQEDIRTFFSPLQLTGIRLLLDDNQRSTGLAFVDFASDKDREEGLKKNKEMIGSRYIELFIDEGEEKERVKRRPWEGKNNKGVESIAESGRIFIRNLPYTTTEEELTKLFEPYGTLTELSLLVNKETKMSIGLAYVTYMFPEHAVRAFSELDGSIFQGRLIHLLPSKPPNKETVGLTTKVGGASSSFKNKRDEKLKSEATHSHNWNTLFLGSNAVLDSMAEQYEVNKSQLLDPTSDQSLAVRLALGETQLVGDTKQFLEDNGVNLNVFDEETSQRSNTVILVKNLPFDTQSSQLHELFSPYGNLSRVILPPSGISALVEFSTSSSAKKAFKKLAYAKFQHLPLYLEWAPSGVINENKTKNEVVESESEIMTSNNQNTLFVKNLNFSTNDEALLSHFQTQRGVVSAIVSKKYNPNSKEGSSLSMGYGFVTFTSHEYANEALKSKQGSELDGHQLELSISRSQRSGGKTLKRKTENKRKLSKNEKLTKILIRNIPFEASRKEIKQLFKTFGEIKSVRLPKKLTSSSDHRGFGFVEYMTSEDACTAYESLSRSTHLYGRRLVLEWAESEDSLETLRAKVSRYYEKGEEPVAKRRKKLAEDLLKVDVLDGNNN